MPRDYTAPRKVMLDQWSLAGDWTVEEPRSTDRTGGSPASTPATFISSWGRRCRAQW
jgi:hypothetical protein